MPTDSSKPTLLTIGHSNHEQALFLELLKKHEVTAIADVRSIPRSKWASQFDEQILEPSLKAIGIRYVFMGRELGARRSEPECYVDGKARYELIEKTRLYQEGLDRLRKGVGRHRIALMCAEADPITCHRTVLVCHSLRCDDLAINHILPDGRLEAHGRSEERLMELAGLDGGLLFGDPAQLLEDAYRAQAEKIAFVKNPDESQRWQSDSGDSGDRSDPSDPSDPALHDRFHEEDG